MVQQQEDEIFIPLPDELINQCLDKHRIIIYGHAKSGKIIIARLLAEKLKRKLIVTDEFMEYGFKQSMYVIKELIDETFRENPENKEGFIKKLSANCDVDLKSKFDALPNANTQVRRERFKWDPHYYPDPRAF